MLVYLIIIKQEKEVTGRNNCITTGICFKSFIREASTLEKGVGRN